MSGFSVRTDLLVGLCPFRLKPRVNTTKLGVAPPDFEGDLPDYEAKVEAIMRTLSAIGTTIGPTAPPAHFVSTDFLQTIISYKEQAIQQGWIKDQGIGISLDAKLNAASAALARGDNKTAVNVLNALLNEVDAQAGKQLLPEAVALLKFNTQYLISKLP